MFDIPFYKRKPKSYQKIVYNENNLGKTTSNLLGDIYLISKIGFLSIPMLLSCHLPTRVRNFTVGLFFRNSGYTMKKIGQWCSTRRDILPTSICDSLACLRDTNKSHKFGETVRILKSDGFEVTEVDSTLLRVTSKDLDGSLLINSKDKPIGSGTVGQVYKCKLNGTDVILKILHPNIERMITKELSTVDKVVRAIIKLKTLHHYNLYSHFDEFKKGFLLQCDLRNEMVNLNILKELNPSAIIPKPLVCTKNVLVEDFIECREININMSNKQAFSRNCLEIIAKMLFNDRFVHADLHPGNVKATSDGKIVLLDGGLCKYFTYEEKKNLYDLICELFYKRDGKSAGNLLISRSKSNVFCKSDDFAEEFSDLCYRHIFEKKMEDPHGLTNFIFYKRKLADKYKFRDIKTGVLDFNNILRKYGVILDPTYSHFLASLCCFDGAISFLYRYLDSSDVKIALLKNIPIYKFVSGDLKNRLFRLFKSSTS